ncbi:hypothetical protein OAF99_03610 [Akkermansiaceae bacterium]|nr:hypothetical protein [Akkermansiaceae bacterium]
MEDLSSFGIFWRATVVAIMVEAIFERIFSTWIVGFAHPVFHASPEFSESLTEFRVGRNIVDSIGVGRKMKEFCPRAFGEAEIEEGVDFWVIGIGEGLNRL